MRFLDKILGSKPAYPPLPADNEAMVQLDEVKAPLEAFAHKVSDRLEVVPAAHEAFVFLGQPPGTFGLAWIHDGKVTSLKEFTQEHHLSQGQVERLLDRLGNAYQHASDTPRYSAEFGGKKMVVIPSKDLEQEMHQIMSNTLH
jgi:hypothetical protein